LVFVVGKKLLMQDIDLVVGVSHKWSDLLLENHLEVLKYYHFGS